MKLIIFLLVIFSPLHAIEWNQESFDSSLKRWNNSYERFKKDPKNLANEMKEKYYNSYNEVKAPLLKNFEKDIEELNHKLDTFYYVGERISHYGKSRNIDSFYSNFMYDVDNTFPILLKEAQEIPLVVPLKLELNNRLDSVRIYYYMLNPYINNVKFKIKDFNK